MKKFIPIMLVVVCALACTFAFTACSNNNQEPYYGKTYTMTGKAIIDWETKLYRDNYKQADNDDHSQKELLTKYWDDIDWDVTLERAGLPADAVPHGSIEEFVALFEETEQNLYEHVKGLQISVSDKSDPKLTITFPTDDNDYFRGYLANNYGSKLTMPLYESDDKLAANKPFNDFPLQEQSLDNPGYFGMGVVKGENNHVMTIRFNVAQYEDRLTFDIFDYELDSDGNMIDRTTVFQVESSIFTLYNKDGNSILSIDCKIDYDVK